MSTTTCVGVSFNTVPFAAPGYNFQYWSGFTKQESFTLEFVNAWNNQWRFAKANLDSDGNLIFSADVVGGGVTLDNIKATAQLFDGLMSELAKFNP